MRKVLPSLVGAALRRALGEAERLAATGAVPLRRGALHGYLDRMRTRGDPAVEHSGAYQEAYHPSYRVVLLPLLTSSGASVAR